MADKKPSDNFSDNKIYREFSTITSVNQKLIGQEKEYLRVKQQLSKKYRIDEMRDELDSAKTTAERKIELQEKIVSEARKIEEESAAIVENLWETTFKQSTIDRKNEMLKQRAEQIRITASTLQEEISIKEAAAAKGIEIDNESLKNKRDRYQSLMGELSDLSSRQQSIERSENLKSFQQIQNARQQGLLATFNTFRKLDKNQQKATKDSLKKQLTDDYNANKEAVAKKLDLQKELMRKEAAGEDTTDTMLQLSAADKEVTATSTALSESRQATWISELSDAIDKLGAVALRTIQNSMSDAENILTSYQSRVNANLQGSDKTFGKILNMTTNNLALSPIVQMKDVLSSIKEASDQGIVYNLEQRAFLDTVADKIAHTFDAFDSNLTRLIRLQQADTTAARLGMEANLTKLFNSTFNDSSYLDKVYDSVSSAILDANSQLDKNASTEFEYTVQKWLGALSSLGLSENTITNIATGINYLATGDVTSLASNTQLQTLMAMSASNAGLDYANILLEGLDASTTNKLMQSMVEYLKTIAENSGNQVVKSAYGDIFNMSLSDMKAISNMTSGDISKIANTNMSYSGLVAETSMQLLQTITRSSLSENMNNIYQNAIFGMGMDMARNPVTYAMNKMLGFMDQTGLDISIPFINVFGSGLDLNTSVNEIMRLGLGLSGAMNLVGNILQALHSPGFGTGLLLSQWGGTEYNQRGSSIGSLLGTLLGGTTSSTYVSTGSSQDMIDSSLNSATDDAANTQKITNKNAAKTDHTLDDLWTDIFGDSATSFAKVQDTLLQLVYDSSNHSLRVIDTPIMNYLGSILGASPVHSGGRIKTIDSILDRANEGGVLKVKDASFGTLLGSVQNNALRVNVVGGSLSATISNVSEISKQLEKSQPSTVKLDSTTKITIDEQVMVNAILKAFGVTDESGPTMQDMITKIVKDKINTSVTTDGGNRLSVSIDNVGPNVGRINI